MILFDYNEVGGVNVFRRHMNDPISSPKTAASLY